MTLSDIEQRLAHVMGSDDLLHEMEDFVQELEKTGASVDMVEPILRFMEAHSEEDLGVPGPLAHIVERFHRQGFEEELLKSLQRKPTMPTLSMLNALVNVTKDENERNRYINAFREALSHPKADQVEREAAAHYLEFQGETTS
jgi:hypothetical protein